MALSGQRLVAASGQIPMAARRPPSHAAQRIFTTRQPTITTAIGSDAGLTALSTLLLPATLPMP